MHIVIHDEDHQIRSADIADHVDMVIVGAKPECHVYLPDLRVADEHFDLRRNADRKWRLFLREVPADSPAIHTRLYLNALEAEDAMEVKHSDEIIIARFRLTVFTDDANATAPRAAIMEEASRIREHPLPTGSVVRTGHGGEVLLPAGEVEALAEFAFRAHDCGDLVTLTELAITTLARRFNAHQVWLGMRRHGYGQLETIQTCFSDGRTRGEPPRYATFEYRCLERGQSICCLQAEIPEIESALCVPLFREPAVLGMLYVDNAADRVPFGERDLDVLTAMGEIIARQFELITRELLQRQEAITAGEQSFVRELQSVMDPTNVPQWDGLQLAVYCRPGLETAGDIFDVMRLPNGLAAFVCGHVSGSPTVTALAMAEARASFRYAGLHADPPHVFLQALNWLLHDPRRPSFFSCVSMVMNPNTGAMQYATAGEYGVVVVDQRGGLRSLARDQAPQVGTLREHKYVSAAGRLVEGDSVVMYSPGCATLTSTDGQALDKERLHEAIRDGFGQTASVALDELLSDLKAYFEEGRQPDDITLMVLHRV